MSSMSFLAEHPRRNVALGGIVSFAATVVLHMAADYNRDLMQQANLTSEAASSAEFYTEAFDIGTGAFGALTVANLGLAVGAAISARRQKY
jgi:hypothetical protein